MPNTVKPTVGSKRVLAKKAPAKKLTSKPRVKPAEKPVVGPEKQRSVVLLDVGSLPPIQAALKAAERMAIGMEKAAAVHKANEIKNKPLTQFQRDVIMANAINNVAARNTKVAFSETNPNTKQDRSHKEVVTSVLDFKVGRKVKVIKVVDRRGNIECVLKGRIKEMTSVGAYVTDFEKPNSTKTEWFPFKSKMQWILLA